MKRRGAGASRKDAQPCMQFFAAGRQRRLHGPFDQNAISGKNSLNIIHAQVPARAASIWTLAKWTTAESAQRGPAACCAKLDLSVCGNPGRCGLAWTRTNHNKPARARRHPARHRRHRQHPGRHLLSRRRLAHHRSAGRRHGLCYGPLPCARRRCHPGPLPRSHPAPRRHWHPRRHHPSSPAPHRHRQRLLRLQPCLAHRHPGRLCPPRPAPSLGGPHRQRPRC